MARPPIFESYSQVLPPPGPEMLPVSKPAVFGLLLSILQCLPVISGAGALTLGVIGIREIRRKQRIGKPIAIAAIAIGAVSMILWLVALTAGGLIATRYATIYQVADEFARSIAGGEFEAARALAGPEVSDETLSLWIADLEVEEARPLLEMQEFEVEEEQFNLDALWNGPFRVAYRVGYRDDDDGTAAAPARRVTVIVTRVEGQLRVTDLSVRPTTSVTPTPPAPAAPEVDVHEP